MILADMANKAEYYGIHPMLDKALDLMTPEFLATVTEPKTLVDGENFFILRADTETVPFEETFYEAHRQYLDVQIMMKGMERIDIADPRRLTLTEQHDDFYGYAGEADHNVILKPGTFMVLFPGDAHRLRIPVNQPGEAYSRIVFKLKVYD